MKLGRLAQSTTALAAVALLVGAAVGLTATRAVLATTTVSACTTGRAVPDAADNPGLVSDCEALLASRDALRGSARLNWSADTPLADWDGLTIGRTPKRVTGLRLNERLLTGKIPPELGSLDNLQLLYLSGNELSGEIPEELGSLSSLQWLNLAANQLSGKLPKELGSLSNLERLRLDDNGLSGTIPVELGSLSNLEWLYLQGNQLIGCIPSGLRDVEINDLDQLGLPFCEAPGTCAAGRAVPDPANNPGLVSDCEALLAARDTLVGTSTPSWSSDSSSRDLGDITVRGLPRGEGLDGETPPGLSNFANIEELHLYNNQLSGEIPPEAPPAARHTFGPVTLNWSPDRPIRDWERVTVGGTPRRVTGLTLSYYRLSGTIPPELGRLSELEWLYLDDNQFRGALPQSLTRLTALETFHFLNNAGLCAPVDSEFQTWLRNIPNAIGSSCAPADSPEDRAALVALYNATDGANWWSRTNWLSDRPIREWRNVVNDANGRVTGLWLNYNGLTGPIPVELGSLSNLERLGLGSNQLTGTIPPELGRLSGLEWLYLDDNLLTGTIPPELGRLSGLERLDFARNRLSGTIPPELASLSNLGVLWLADNELTGTIPPQLGSLSNLWNLDLSNNQLSGTIPPDLSNLSNLKTLDLSNNQLSGTIPPELGTLPTLWFLELHGNQFSGCVPEGLRDVPYFYFYGLRLPYCDVVLSNLTVSPRSLTPPFDPYHTSYTALEGPSRVTVIATNDHDAKIEFLDLVGGAIADADGSQEGHQVDLSGDLAAIRVRVTSQDGEATRVYTIRMLPPCATAVPDASNNPGLVSDCEALLAVQDTLAGSARRYWLASIPITDWRGVSMGGTPRRVTGLHLSGSWLDGSIPRELGDLSNLIRTVPR